MGKPTNDELKQALTKAADMREHGEDPDFLAKSLLNMNYRFSVWQKVIEATKRYLHSGHGSTEHARLVSAMREAERIESESEHAKERIDRER
tara:strand:+ start:75 stop:350 length:276 start_codon:yes stop_codon:yes gene_type:complete